MKSQAIIFDMDGLLIDSIIHWIEMDTKFFGDRGAVLTPEIMVRLNGKSQIENATWLINHFGWPETPEEYIQSRKSMIDSIYSHKTLIMPGADELVKKIAISDKKQAIASGAQKEWIDMVTTRFGWKEYIDEELSVDHVGHKGKPEPDVYLYAAKKLCMDPQDCIVFEDAENGVVAAKRAGMTCIAVPDKRWSHGDFSQADLIVDSLENPCIFDYMNL